MERGLPVEEKALFPSTSLSHNAFMTDLLEKAVTTARGLSPEMQDEIARVVLALAGDDEPMIALTPEEEADLMEAQAEMARGEFATDDEVKAVFAKYRL